MQAADDGLITEQVTLNGVLAGSLPTIITDDNKNLITNLKINGEINGTDLKFIREMAGRSVNGDETEGKLSILDLSDTKIVSGGKRYFHDMVNGASYFTKDDEIGDNAFYQCSGLKSLTLPDGITLIGEKAFLRCTGLTNITIPEGVTFIGMSAFIYCRNLTSITIPAGVTTISSFTFEGCTSLTNLTLPDDLTKIGDGAFGECSGLTNLTFPSSLTKIGDNAFYQCSGLKSLTFPNGLTEIGDKAFAYCSGLRSLTLPDGLTKIGAGIFQNCSSLMSLTIPSSITEVGSNAFDGCSSLNEVRYIIHDDLAAYVQRGHPDMDFKCPFRYYLNGKEITSLEIPTGVTSIKKNAFCGCSSLTNLTLPAGITEIGDKAFCICSGLGSLTLPDGITEINSYTFATCLNLTSLTLSANLTSISLGGFKGCFALKNLTIPSGLTSLSNLHITDISTTIESVYVSSSVPATAGSFFDGVDLSNCTLYVPKGMIWNYKLADVWKNFGKIIEYDTTGIDKVTTRSDVKVISRFSLDGQRLTAPTKGMNIVVYSDGSIKKVAVQ